MEKYEQIKRITHVKEFLKINKKRKNKKEKNFKIKVLIF